MKALRELIEPRGGLLKVRVSAQPDGAIERLDLVNRAMQRRLTSGRGAQLARLEGQQPQHLVGLTGQRLDGGRAADGIDAMGRCEPRHLRQRGERARDQGTHLAFDGRGPDAREDQIDDEIAEQDANDPALGGVQTHARPEALQDGE